MPDYIYLLENRLSADQQSALRHLRDAAREAEMILFLTGDAVRDLSSGHAVRDIEVAVSGNALDLKKPLKNTPVQIWGEDPASRSLYLCFPGTVRVDVVSAHRVEYPKPGQAVIHPASIQEDLRRRDFTVNAMAISLNDGSYGLLMDPLNGAADIEARTLRLVSNYGFLEEPALLIRGTRFRARLGWEFDPKTQMRYENAKAEGVIELLSAHERSRELEQIGHEDEGLRVLQALETEGWLKALTPSWTAAKADEEKLKALHGLVVDLLVQGVHPDMSAAQMQLLTARMPPKDLAALKKQMLRPGFVEEWNSLDAVAAGFAKVLLAKENQSPAASYKLFMSYDPEAVLWLGFTAKDAAVKDRYNNFLKVWPEVRQRMPHALMQEMRIRPDLPNYNEIVHAIFLELIDGKLNTPEEMKAFLEPYSPPAPPPQVTIKRTRGRRGEAKVKDYEEEEESEEEGGETEEDLDEMGGDEDEIGLGIPPPKGDLEPDSAEEDEGDEEEAEDQEEERQPAPVRRGSKAAGKATAAVEAHPAAPVRPEKSAPKTNGPVRAPEKAAKLHAAAKHEPEPRHAGAHGAGKTGHPAAKPAAHAPARPATPSKGKPASHPVKKAAAVTHGHKASKPAPAKSPAKSTHSKAAPARHVASKAHVSHPAPARNAKAHKSAPKKTAKKH